MSHIGHSSARNDPLCDLLTLDKDVVIVQPHTREFVREIAPPHSHVGANAGAKVARHRSGI
jgi:hypothetical protein